MAIIITQTTHFYKTVKDLIAHKKLLHEDFEDFKKGLAQNPESGDMIVGTGGIRKTRLKSASKGKSGGFRVCYYYYVSHAEVFLLLIYPKNIKETLTDAEKKALKNLVSEIKGK